MLTWAVSALKSASNSLFLPGNIPCICSVTAVLTASIGMLPVGLNLRPLLITGQLFSTTASIAPNLSVWFEDGELIMLTKSSLVYTPSFVRSINSCPLLVIDFLTVPKSTSPSSWSFCALSDILPFLMFFW